MIIALAGRRVDAEQAKEPRFPPGNFEIVRVRLRALLQDEGATALVSSAACGADLIALSEAGALKIHRKVVLPFERERFRKTSVVDRPGEWGLLYDGILDQIEASEDLVLVERASVQEAYLAANQMILDQAISMATQSCKSVKAVLVWDGKPRAGDITEAFGREAQKRHFPLIEISTL
jgi:hypothetical protein